MCVRHRSDHWWNFVVLRMFTPSDWIENFRMSQQILKYLCQRLSPTLKRRYTVMQRCIAVEQRIAVTLWCLATPTEYHTIAHLSGIARSSVCEIIHEMCCAIVDCLLSTYLNFPSGEQLERVVSTFETKWRVPQCVGAIDGCHIPMAAPVNNHTDNFNRKGFYSIILQGVVDVNYCFLTYVLDGREMCMMCVCLYILHFTKKLVKRNCCLIKILL